MTEQSKWFQEFVDAVDNDEGIVLTDNMRRREIVKVVREVVSGPEFSDYLFLFDFGVGGVDVSVSRVHDTDKEEKENVPGAFKSSTQSSSFWRIGELRPFYASVAEFEEDRQKLTQKVSESFRGLKGKQ